MILFLVGDGFADFFECVFVVAEVGVPRVDLFDQFFSGCGYPFVVLPVPFERVGEHGSFYVGEFTGAGNF